MDTLELLATGYGLVEGPRVDGDGNLYFSDVHGGGVRRLTPEGETETVVPKRRGVGGIALHADGGIVISGRDISHVRDGESRTVFAPDAPGLNDLFVDTAGRVICATMRSDPFAPEGPRVTGEAWLLGPDGSATELYDDIALTNGIAFSPDGTVLYHADTTRGIWAHVYDDGRVANRRLLVPGEDFLPDGLAVDEAGIIWVADVWGAGGVRAFDPTGVEVDRIAVPAPMVTSICFGGPDRRDVYIVTGGDAGAGAGSIFHTRAATPGVEVPLARV